MKIAPCPNCHNTDYLAVYTYDSGWRHVECDCCGYLGPGEGSKKAAISEHNKRVALTKETT